VRFARIAMYAGGMSPFLCPFVTTLSINSYSGVHSKPDDLRAHGLDPEIRQRLQSETNLVEAWPVELSFQCTLIPERLTVDALAFSTAVPRAIRWLELASSNSSLSLAGDAAQSVDPSRLERTRSPVSLCQLRTLIPNRLVPRTIVHRGATSKPDI